MPEPHSHGVDGMPVYPDAVQVDAGEGAVPDATPDGPVAGVPVVRAFPFAFDTPGLADGAALYTPTAGDILFDAWVEVVEAWDGTTPTCDFGTFLDFDADGTGWLGAVWGPMDLTIPDQDDNSNGILLGQLVSGSNAITGLWKNLNAIGDTGLQVGRVALNKQRTLPSKFSAASPIKVCVNTNGNALTGTDPGATQGAAVLYLVTATPATV